MKQRRNAGSLLGLFVLAACTAEIGAPHEGAGGGSGGGTGSPGGTGGPGGGGGSGNSGELAPERTWPTPAFSRLTHEQYENTVVDVFGLSEDEAETLAASFGIEPGGSGYLFDNHTVALYVDDALWNAYRRAADDVGRLLFEQSERGQQLARAHGGGEDGEASAQTFIERFGARVHRRPLDDAQVGPYLDVYRIGRDVFPDMNDPHLAGLRLVVQAFAQSPHFLYRVESGTDPSAAEVPLDAYEVATRLSYFLWNTAPDATLLAAAESGELTQPEGIRTHAERMLADPRAEDVVVDFHRQLLDVSRYERIGPSPAFFPDVSDRLPELAEEETELFVRMIYTEDGGLTELFTSRETFVNAELARIYGVDDAVGPDAMTRVELDPGTRKGVFTQVGFLASHATAVNPDPIHRGIFLSERMACNTIGVPPGEIPPLPPPEGRTNREVVEDHTEQPGSECIACHGSLINPFGFAFESYDAAGGVRTEDNGYPVDTTGAPRIGTDDVPVSGAMELIDVMATSDVVHECYAKHWMELAFGVVAEKGRDGLVERLADESLDGASVRDLLLGIVTSETFRTRRGGADG